MLDCPFPFASPSPGSLLSSWLTWTCSELKGREIVLVLLLPLSRTRVLSMFLSIFAFGSTEEDNLAKAKGKKRGERLVQWFHARNAVLSIFGWSCKRERDVHGFLPWRTNNLIRAFSCQRRRERGILAACGCRHLLVQRLGGGGGEGSLLSFFSVSSGTCSLFWYLVVFGILS